MAIQDVSGKTIGELVSLAGRVAVITGGAGGIGLSIARRLAEAGANIVIGDIDKPQATAAAEALAKDFAVKAIGVTVDVTDESTIIALADTTVREMGRLDIWVNNAGIFPGGNVVDVLAATWDQVHDINLRGTFLGAREAARRMTVQEPKGGVIVNVASVRGLRGGRGLSAYASSKHGVVGLTKSLGIELGPHNIRVLAVAPTGIATPGVARNKAQATGDEKIRIETKEAAMKAALPLGRLGTPDDVARVVLFCASDFSMLMTGSTILVDAGALA